MSKFKVGDYVVVIAGPDKSSEVHVVESSGNPTYPLRVAFCTYTEDGRLLTNSKGSYMRLATAEEIEASKKSNLLRRGDLVECRGVLCVVYSEGEDFDGYYWIASLTGIPETHRIGINELTRVGSISKKVNRLQAQMEDVK